MWSACSDVSELLCSHNYNHQLVGFLLYNHTHNLKSCVCVGCSLVDCRYDHNATALLFNTFLSPKNPDGNEPVPDGMLLNGVGQHMCRAEGEPGSKGQPVCQYARLVAQKKGSYAVRLRLISMAGFGAFNVTVDGHEMKLVAVDSIPVVPVTVG